MDPLPAAAPVGGWRAEIDGLRGLAVLAVILNHVRAPLLPGGYLGVDIFFVISGYVITASLLQRSQRAPAAGFADFLAAFYDRRVRRLVPALVACVLITGALVCVVDPSPGTTLRTGIASLFGVSNLYLQSLATDYFAPATELNAFTHTWSLGVEEQFYLLYPLLFWASGCGRRADGPARRRLGFALLLLAVASLASFVWLYGRQPASAYFLGSSRFWEMAAGCLLALAPVWRGPTAATGAALAAVGLVAVLFAPLRLGLPATLAAVLLSVLLIAALASEGPARRVFRWRPLVTAGLLSYALYLWHWSVFALCRWSIGLEGWALLLALTLTVLLALASWRWIETPLRHRPWAARRRGTLAIGLRTSALAGLALALLGGPLQGRLYAGRLPDPTAPAALQRQERRCLLNPELLGGAEKRPPPRRDAAFLRSCLAGEAGQQRRPALLLVGDSFSGVAAPHLAVAAAQRGLAFRSLSGFSCPYPLPFAEVRGATAERCPVIDEALLQRELLAALGPGDVLALRWHAAKPQYLHYPPAPGLPDVGAYDRPLLALAEAVRARGARLLVIGANPVLSSRHLAVLVPQWFNRGSSLARLDPRDNPETRYAHRHEAHLRRLLADRPGIAYVPVMASFCDAGGQCQLRLGDRPLYSDAEHLSPWGFEQAAPALERALDQLLADRPG